MPQSDAGGLIQLIIVGVIVVASILGKLLTKKDKEAEGGSGSGEKSSPGPTHEAEPMSPDEALEQMFREMQGRRKTAPPATPPVARQVPEQSLDQYFEHREQPAATRPVPKAPAREYREPAPRAYRPMRKPVPPRVMLRRPKAAFAKPEGDDGPSAAAEQVRAMAQAKARVEAAAALAGPDAKKVAVAHPAAAKPLVILAGGKPDRAEVARAMVYLEVFGPPRAVRAFEGPPSAG